MLVSYGISYFGGAPITMNTMLSYPNKKKFTHPVKMMVAGGSLSIFYRSAFYIHT